MTERIALSKVICGWPITLVGSAKGISEVILGKEAGVRASGRLPWAENALQQLEEYFQGRRREFDLPLEALQGTAFQKKVWGACARIGFGRVRSYGELAREVGAPKASRAVGAALGRNPVPILIPCHRVVGAAGGLTGFSCGLEWKRKLLKLEGYEVNDRDCIFRGDEASF